MYIIKLNEHKNDKPHGIVNNMVGIKISKLFSFIVQFDGEVLLSKSVLFVVEVLL